jgi:hypothetical protein
MISLLGEEAAGNSSRGTRSKFLIIILIESRQVRKHLLLCNVTGTSLEIKAFRYSSHIPISTHAYSSQVEEPQKKNMDLDERFVLIF